MNRLIFFTAAFFVSTLTFAQSDLKKGFVITSSTDTLFGLINYKEGLKSYKSVTFKKSNGGSPITYTANEIRGYGFIDGKYFESKKITEEKESPQVVFVEVKVNGGVSLYKFDYSFFVAKTGDTLRRLNNEIGLKQVDGKLVEWNGNQHVVILNWLLFDCAELRERVQKTRLVERELTSLIEDYNKCTGKTVVTYNANKPWIKIGVAMTAGLQISQLEFSTSVDNFKHLRGTFDVSKSPVAGFSFDILAPRISERFSFHGDLLYIFSKYQNVNIFTNYYSTERDYVTIKLHQLKMPVGVRYTFPEKKITPYINMGFSATIHLSSASTWTQEVEGHFNDVFIRQEMNEALPITSLQLGYWGGVGVTKFITSKLRVFLELRYEHTNGVARPDPNESLRSRIHNFQITLGVGK